MGCNSVNDYNHSVFCDGAGGVKKWYTYLTFDSVGDPAVNYSVVDGKITGATVLSGDFSLKTWRVESQTSTFTDTAMGERTAKSKSRQMAATIVFHGVSKQLVADIDSMGGARLTLICEDNRGNLHLLFKDFGGTFKDVFTPGTAMADSSGNTITISGDEIMKAPIIDSTVLDTLVQTGVIVYPEYRSLPEGTIGTAQYTAVVYNGILGTVTWTIDTATGLSIDSAGLVSITAMTPAGTYTLTATSVDDATKTSTATIEVIA